MSAAEAVLRVLEELRQSALTEALGQVTCPSSDVHADLGLCWPGCWVCSSGRGPQCPDCKAAV